MQFKLKRANVVILANSFNPSLIGESWLRDENVLHDGEQIQDSIFTDSVAQTVADPFQLLVLEDRLQFAPESVDGNIVEERLSNLVEAIPHTPFAAAGGNFTWEFVHQTRDVVRDYSEQLFRGDSPLYAEFASEDAFYGGYMSKQFSDTTRVRLEAKPQKEPEESTEGESEPRYGIEFAFNFHRDFEDGDVEEVSDFLSKWADFHQFSEKITDGVEP